MRHLKSIALRILFIPAAAVFAIVALLVALCVRRGSLKRKQPRLVWGSTPVINNSYWSLAMRGAGFRSETYTTDFFSRINKRENWDRILSDEHPLLPGPGKPYAAFLGSLLRYDVFFLPFSGFFIGTTALWRLQAPLLHLAGKKIVLIPYGSDSYVYRRIRSTSVIQALMVSYPLASRRQTNIARRVDYWCKHADIVIPCFMGPDGFGRWDVLLPSSLFIDLDQWRPSSRESNADGSSGTVNVVHAANHRAFKGTEFVVEAVERLKREGLKVELILLEGKQNSEVQRVLEHEADILVEQLIATGHALSGLEGLASGIPVISNLEDEAYLLPVRRWTFFSECPIVSASPETVVDVLRKLVTRPKLRHQLGKAGRQYAEKYQGLDSARYLFGQVIDFLYGRRESLVNLYHPLLGEYPKRLPKVEHPLVNNRIVG